MIDVNYNNYDINIFRYLRFLFIVFYFNRDVTIMVKLSRNCLRYVMMCYFNRY